MNFLTNKYLIDTYNSKTNFQFQPFRSNPTGKAPPTRGRSVLKKEKRKRKKKKKKGILQHFFETYCQYTICALLLARPTFAHSFRWDFLDGFFRLFPLGIPTFCVTWDFLSSQLSLSYSRAIYPKSYSGGSGSSLYPNASGTRVWKHRLQISDLPLKTVLLSTERGRREKERVKEQRTTERASSQYHSRVLPLLFVTFLLC